MTTTIGQPVTVSLIGHNSSSEWKRLNRWTWMLASMAIGPLRMPRQSCINSCKWIKSKPTTSTRRSDRIIRGTLRQLVCGACVRACVRATGFWCAASIESFRCEIQILCALCNGSYHFQLDQMIWIIALFPQSVVERNGDPFEWIYFKWTWMERSFSFNFMRCLSFEFEGVAEPFAVSCEFERFKCQMEAAHRKSERESKQKNRKCAATNQLCLSGEFWCDSRARVSVNATKFFSLTKLNAKHV